MKTALLKLNPFLAKGTKVDRSISPQIKQREIRMMIHQQAERVVRLQYLVEAHYNLLPEHLDEVELAIAHTELEAAERVFYMLFNQLRVLYGLTPFEGTKFIGDYNYQAFI